VLVAECYQAALAATRRLIRTATKKAIADSIETRNTVHSTATGGVLSDLGTAHSASLERRPSHVRLWLRRGVDETPMFKDLERHHHKVQLPIKEVVVEHWKRLIIAGSVRISSDIVYGLLVVFTLTWVTEVLHLPRSLALTATMLGAALHAVCVPYAVKK